MRILVTGGAGFAGRHLLAELLKAGAEAIVATVLDEDPPADFAEAETAGRVRWVRMDVTSSESVAAAIADSDPEVVYHLAGQASVGESFANPLLTWEVNATGTLRLLTALTEAASRTVRRVLLISSAEVYGAVEAGNGPIRESRPYRPVTPYGASKAAAELASMQVGVVAGIDVVVARSFNHIGPGQDQRFVLPNIARQLARVARGEAESVLRVGNLEVVRDLLDVRDVARAYVLLMNAGRAGTCYNVCSGNGRSLLQVVRRMVELSQTGAELSTDPKRVRMVDIPALVGDPSLLKELGWTPRIGLDESLRDLLADAKRNP